MLWHLEASSLLVFTLPAESIWAMRLDRLLSVMASSSEFSAEGPSRHNYLLSLGPSEPMLVGLQAMQQDHLIQGFLVLFPSCVDQGRPIFPLTGDL